MTLDAGPDPFTGPESSPAPPIPVHLAARLPRATPKHDPAVRVPSIPYALGRFPRVDNGVVVPSSTLRKSKRAVVEMFPVGNIGTVRVARSSVVCYLRTGKPVVLWIGDDDAERDAALEEFLGSLGEWQTRPRRRA